MTTALLVLSIVGAAASLLSVLTQLPLRSHALDYRNDEILLSEFTDKLGPYVAASVLAGLISIATLVVQIIWTFRMARNLQTLARQPRFSPGGTIAVNILGGCTLNIVPYFMWRELWKGSDPASPRGDPAWRRQPVGAIVHLWFAASLAMVGASMALGFAGAVTRFNRGSNATFAKQLDEQFGFIVAAGLMTVVAGVAFVVLVRQLSTRHMQAAREA